MKLSVLLTPIVEAAEQGVQVIHRSQSWARPQKILTDPDAVAARNSHLLEDSQIEQPLQALRNCVERHSYRILSFPDSPSGGRKFNQYTEGGYVPHV